MALLGHSSGCTPRASLIGVESNGQLESLRSRAVCKQKTPVVVSESPRSQASAACFSVFRLPTSRGECTRRATAPAPLTHHARSLLPLSTHPLLGQVKSRTTIWLCSSGLITPLPRSHFCAYDVRWTHLPICFLFLCHQFQQHLSLE